jgi:hypothetical protein
VHLTQHFSDGHIRGELLHREFVWPPFLPSLLSSPFLPATSICPLDCPELRPGDLSLWVVSTTYASDGVVQEWSKKGRRP